MQGQWRRRKQYSVDMNTSYEQQRTPAMGSLPVNSTEKSGDALGPRRQVNKEGVLSDDQMAEQDPLLASNG